MNQPFLYFLFWGLLIFVMMRFGCGAHVMGHGHRHNRGADHDNPDRPGWALPTRDVDPVCGMSVEAGKAKTAVHDGRAYYFCSAECREKFETDPASYVGPAAAERHAMEHHHDDGHQDARDAA